MPAKPLDEIAFTERLRAALGGRRVAPVQPLTGGTSSLTYWTTIDGEEKVVVKICPPGLEPVRNRDVLRQARIQRALAPTPVPVPRVVAADAGDPPDEPPFYVMDFVDGECVEVGFASGDPRPPGQVRSRQLQTARLMGELHRLDPVAIGLGEEPETSLEDEVRRWVDMFAACDEDQKAGTEPLGRRLLDSAPPAMPSSILHGDFRTGNTMAKGEDVLAVIDWEIWSRTDPRIDVAWFLQFIESAPSPPEGTPSVDELLAEYEQTSGRQAGDLDWFRALVRYKQAAAGAFIQRNARRRGAEVVPADNENSPLLNSVRHYLDLIGA